MHVLLLSAQFSCDESERLQSKTFVQGSNQLCFLFFGGHPYFSIIILLISLANKSVSDIGLNL